MRRFLFAFALLAAGGVMGRPLKAIVVDGKSEPEEFAKQAAAAGLVGTPGHRSVGGMRVSLYNAVEPSSLEALVSFMREFQRKRG